MAEHNDLGRIGENIARDYLITNGYTIIDQDSRKGFYEIDLIATKGNRIIFVEVKTRREGSHDPFEAITPKKIRRICRAADSLIRKYGYRQEAQFDVIAVIVAHDGTFRIQHIPDAFYPPVN